MSQKGKRMKKIIGGKLYNTKTATCYGSYEYSYRRDYKHFLEKLYQKTTGEFYLYATGGPLSKYRIEVATRLWRGSETIIPLTKEEERLWAEEHLDVNTYEKLFGTAIE